MGIGGCLVRLESENVEKVLVFKAKSSKSVNQKVLRVTPRRRLVRGLGGVGRGRGGFPSPWDRRIGDWDWGSGDQWLSLHA